MGQHPGPSYGFVSFLGLNRPILYAAAKRRFRGSLRNGGETKAKSREEKNVEKFYLGDEMAYKMRSEGNAILPNRGSSSGAKGL